MKRFALILTIVGAVGVTTAVRASGPERPAAAPSRWANVDSADVLWRQGRSAFSDGDWERAAELFAAIRTTYPKSANAGDALYYEAYALYRIGEKEGLRRALALLDKQGREYAGATTMKNREARALGTRIKGALARGGDAASAEDIAAIASSAEISSTVEARAEAVAARVAVVADLVGAIAERTAEAQARVAERAVHAPVIAGRGRSGRSTVPAGCAAEEDDERLEALSALMQMNADQALPILKKVLARRDKCSELLRRKAVFLVSQKRSDEAADILLAAAKTDPDDEVREQSVFWLSQVSGEKAEQFLLGILRESKDAELQNKALFALSQRRSERAQQALRDFAAREDAPGELREQAIFWIGQKRSEENAQFLRTLFGKAESSAAREKILFSLGQMRGMGNETFLLEQAGNPKWSMDVRKQALFAASQGGGVPAAQLGAIYDKSADTEMREQVIFALSQRSSRDAAAVDKLLEVAKNEKDKELRKKAIFWLGQSKDPRAAKLLQELIER